MPPPRRHIVRAAAMGGSILVLAACTPAEAERGRQLYVGELPLDGRLAGHDAALPTHASRCANCHDAPAAAQAASSSPFGSPLDRARLTQPTARRGGPPSRFDEASLCRLLRTGIDPAHIIVPRAMPRYRIDDADCRALWAHLSRAS